MKFDDTIDNYFEESNFNKTAAMIGLGLGLSLNAPNVSADQTNIAAETQQSVISPAFMHNLSNMESSGNPKAVGDGGLALGLFQLHRGAWEQVEKNIPYNKENAFNPKINRRVAEKYLLWIEKYINRHTKKQPTIEQIYAGWNWGIGRLRKVDFDPTRAPQQVQLRAAKLKHQ